MKVAEGDSTQRTIKTEDDLREYLGPIKYSLAIDCQDRVAASAAAGVSFALRGQHGVTKHFGRVNGLKTANWVTEVK